MSETGSTDAAENANQDGDLQELGGAQGFCQRAKLFTKYAVQDVGRNKCHFSLAFCSVFVVVLSILVVNTIVDMGPLIFLSLAESQIGQIDAIFSLSENPVYTEEEYNNYKS
jgi:hypothetical protein